MKLLKIVVFLFLFVSCNTQPNFTVRSFKVEEGWGYFIEINDITVIKQTVIPTISNKRSFISEADALKVGNLVLERIKQNLSPTVTKKDLILLKISI